MLTKKELTRYSRQIMMPEWDKAGQEKLKNASVFVAGAGGLGSPVLTYLAVAGVGRLKIVDCDIVELSNLNRQMLHPDKNIGKSKVESAKKRLEELNPDIRIDIINETINNDNVDDLVDDCLIVDALDNLQARYCLNKASLEKGLPLFHGAVYGLEGRVTTIVAGKTPCIRCLYKDVIPGKPPVVGVTPGIIGCLQATEVIKYILGIGEMLYNRLLIFDGLSLKFTEVKIKKDPNCDVCGSSV